MENNRTFYIQYSQTQPVGLETHILNTNTFTWLQTLFTAGHLVAAYKTVVAPLLDTSLAQLTLYTPDGDAIPGNTRLIDIQQTAGSYQQPLIIRSLGTVSMDRWSFYIQYSQNQPVEINSHINVERTALGLPPIENVGHLVASYKTVVAPLLDHTSLAQLTLHMPDGDAIPGNTRLIDIQQTAGSYQQPLIIRSLGTVSMDRWSFYIQYSQNQPVEINSHINVERTALGLPPIENVGHLVASYKTVVAPLLDRTSLAQLTLHMPDGDAIPGNTRLMDIQQTASSYQQPLIIRSLGTVSMDNHMMWSLPQPVYDNPVPRPNTTGGAWRSPTHVFLWSDFKESVVRWIDDNHQQHSQSVQRPVFVPGLIISEEVQSLQPFMKLNLLDVSAQCFIPPSEFKARRHITSCVGEPDYLMTRNGEIVAIVEVKGNWTLSTDDVINSYSTTTACASALNQLYHYMRLNHRKYGILSTYENTWFVYRSQECAVCDEPQGHETLYVSEGISFTARIPTVQQCLSYFNSIVDHVHMDSPPTSKQRQSRAGSATQISRPSSLGVSSCASLSRGGSPLSSEIQISEQAQGFDVDDFKFDTVLGEGRSKVYLDYYGSSRIALKVADIAKHGEMLPELLNEVSVYEQLSGLQGNGIPRFFCHGFVEDVLYCVGVSICGTVANGFTEQQKQKLLETLKSIHEAGILHNDIKKENILIDESGNPYIIDFGFSTRSCSPDAQMEERNLLLSLVEST